MKTPIILIIYHRQKLVKNLIDSLRKIKPSKIYVVADGPKNKKDLKLCLATRKHINSIDWPCKIYKKYSKTNKGLRNNVVSGLNWAFKKENKAIILEDDLVIDPSFFKFCEKLLIKYAKNKRIISIAGNNFQFGKNPIKESYYFSRYVHSWGWATWKRAWKLFDDEMSDWPKLRKNNWLNKVFQSRVAGLFWKKIFDMTFNNEVDSWAYRWTYTSFLHNKLTIIPKNNLVSNVGYGKNATHTKQKGRNLDMPLRNIDFPLIHPSKVKINKVADLRTEKKVYLNPIMLLSLFLRNFLQILKIKYDK